MWSINRWEKAWIGQGAIVDLHHISVQSLENHKLAEEHCRGETGTQGSVVIWISSHFSEKRNRKIEPVYSLFRETINQLSCWNSQCLFFPICLWRTWLPEAVTQRLMLVWLLDVEEHVSKLNSENINWQDFTIQYTITYNYTINTFIFKAGFYHVLHVSVRAQTKLFQLI